MAGCGKESGPQRVSVSGEVAYNGQPVKAGTITFGTDRNGTGGVAVIRDGEFQVEKGLPLGSYTIMINAVKENLIDLPPLEAAKRPDSNLAVPKKYTDFKTSGLTMKIVEGDSSKHLDLELTD
tara:strand:+ start:415 stop:783 length:369 start_codon:yes stop_codon:yes gene_type:complete